MRPIPILLTLAAVLAVAAIAVATIFDNSSDSPSVNAPPTLGLTPTPFCTFMPGEGNICVEPHRPVCLPTTDHIPFISRLVLPRNLPEGLNFDEACYTADSPGVPSSDNAEIKYASGDGTAHFQVSTIILAVDPRDRESIQLGSIPGYIIRTPGADGKTIYGVEFALGGRAYTVIAILGPDNRLTEADLNAVALEMATQA